jgi:diguanylate cyclase (GGDEF)-like protein
LKNNPGKKIRINNLLLLLCVLGVSFYALTLNRASMDDYLSLSLFYAVVMSAVWLGFMSGLVFSLIGILVYGGFYFLMSLQASFQVDIGLKETIWIVLLPVGAFIGGALGDSIGFAERFFKKFSRQVESLLLSGQAGMVGTEETFVNNLKEECSRAKRSLSQFSVVTMDVANLDAIQSKLGADAIVQVSEKLSELLCRSTRDIDRKAQLDGSVHSLILVDCPEETVDIALNRLNKLLKSVELEYRGRQIPVQIELKFGVANFPGDGDNGPALLETAFERMKNVPAGAKRSAEPAATKAS